MLGRYFTQELKLPVTVAVDTVSVQPVPDGRLIRRPPPILQDQYYRWQFIMTDQAGKIVLLFPNAPSEKQLDAWIARLLASNTKAGSHP